MLKYNNYNYSIKNIYCNGFIICTYIGATYGFLLGFHEFKNIKTPFINIIQRMLNHTLDGILIGISWPVSLIFLPLITFDYMKKNIDNK